MDWKPIESAPRDGTPVLLWVEDRAIEGQWVEYCFPDEDNWKLRWAECDGYGVSPDVPPTHWCPIVPPDD